MPYAALKPCGHPGCPALVPSGRCQAHQRDRVRRYEADRPNSTQRGYGARWQRYRRLFLRRHPICACGCGRPSTDVDHIVPVSGADDPLFWEPTNHQALTHECHSRKTAKEDGRWG